MPLLRQEGCCGSSLRRTCLIMSIVFFIIVTTFTICEAILLNAALLSYVLIIGIVLIVTAACLVLATIMENKYLCIPFFVAFVIAIVDCIYWIVNIMLSVSHYENSIEDLPFIVWVPLLDGGLTVVVAFVMIIYVIPYYKQLGGV